MDGILVSMGDLAARWLPALVDVTLKGTLILGVAGLATGWGMRRAAAATRHLVWSAAVVAVLALPLLAVVVPRWTAHVVPPALARAAAALREPPAPPALAPVSPAEPASPATPPTLASSAASVAAPTSAPHASVDAPRAPAASDTFVTPEAPATPTWLVALFGVWAAGVLIALLRLALGTVGLARLVRRARPADDPSWVMPLQRLARELGIRRPVSLYVGRTGTVPVTWGVVYPVVLLPADAASWSEERRRAVLLHELAHVERLDALTQVLAQLAAALFWFNPLVALAGRRLRAERERACDDLVLAAGGVPATRYADDLLDLVRTLGEGSPAAAALAMARRSEFEGRLLAILDPAAPRARTDRRRALAAAALVAIAAVPLAGMRATAAPAAIAARRAPIAPGVVPVAPPAPLVREVATLDEARAQVERIAGPTAARTPCSATPAESARFTWVYDASGSEGCLQARMAGTVAFSAEPADVRLISDGGALVLVESRDGVTRRMEVTPRDGRLVRRYTVNGVEHPVEDGEGWFRATLRNVIRRAGLDVDARVASVRAGTTSFAAGIAEVRRTTGDASRRRLLLALLETGLTADELQQVTMAARAITSDGDKSAVLRAVTAQRARTPAVSAAVVGASRGITSDGDRRRVLERTVAPDLPPAVVADLARAVRGMTSDGDKAAVLLKLVPRAGETPEIRAAFFSALGGFTSDGDRKRVVLAALERWSDDSMLVASLTQLRGVTSDPERGEILRAVARRGRMESVPVRERFFRAVDATVSESVREQVLLTALRTQPSCVDTQRGVIAASTKIVSESRRANLLLEVAKTTGALRDPQVRAPFLDALKGMTSSSEYRRVMEAVVP